MTADSHLSGTGGLELQIDAVPTNSQMDLYPLSYASEHIGATSSDISAAASKTKVNTKKVLLKINLEKFILPLLSEIIVILFIIQC